MNLVLVYVLAFISSYLLGGIPFGFIVAKAKGINIREVGSGNIGATNVFRAVGKKEGIFVFLMDFLKGLIPVLFWKHYGMYPGLVSAIGAILGHTLTPYLKFRGGKGIATGFGSFLGLFPAAILSSFGVWVLFLLISGIVSVGSIMAAITFPLFYSIYAFKSSGNVDPVILVFTGIISIYIIYKHRGNIKRLFRGEEPRILYKKKPPEKEGK